MSLFKKKKKGVSQFSAKDNSRGVPKLPELPSLPELPPMDSNSEINQEPLPQLPSFPDSSLGKKFSQDTIKEAVTGKKEVDGSANDFGYIEDQRMQLPRSKEISEENFPEEDMEEEIEEYEKPRIKPRAIERSTIPRKTDPIFIRLDKFEESLEIFEKAKDQIHEIEDTLKHIKHLKEKEEEELTQWESEIQTIKNQIEKVDQDVFSKVQ